MDEFGTSLLTTKLFVPPARTGLVARPRLLERLGTALNCSLVLISAPAGFGKTTLASGWVRQSRGRTPTAWVSLDDGDNDPVRFWDYFIAALRTIKATTGETALGLLHSPQPYPIESALTALINDLTTFPNDFVIVLDDYHLIKSEPIQAGIIFLLDHLPSKMHLIIATRTDPPLPLAHLRGRGTMLEIGADDLRFTTSEAASLLKEQGAALSVQDVSALNARTEGWAVGLKMAAISLGQRKDAKDFIQTFNGSHRNVTSYLMEEVLNAQPGDVRRFLLTTSVLEKLTPGLCDHVLGQTGARDMLSRLESSLHGFLVPLDESGDWFRYHHLFAELLRHQLALASGPQEQTRLHKAASRWYEENSLPDDGIRHAMAARDWNAVMRMVYAQCESRIGRGEWNTVFRWLQAIPVERLRRHQQLYIQYTNVLITTGEIQAAEAGLRYLERTTPRHAPLQGEVAFLHMLLARRQGDIPRTIEMAGRAIAMLPPDALAMRSRASFHLGRIEENTGDHKNGWLHLTDAYELGRRAGDSWTAAGAAAHLSVLLYLRGRLSEALRIGQKGAEIAGESPAASSPWIAVSIVLYERNDLEGSVLHALRAFEFSRLGGPADHQVWACELLAHARLAQGDAESITEAIDKEDEAVLHPTVGPITKAIHAADHVMFALRQDDLETASEWGRRLAEYPDLEFRLRYIPSRLLIACGDKTAAARQLRHLYEEAVNADARGCAIRLRICQALASSTPAEALEFLTDALKMGHPEGFIRTFVDEGKLLAPLLREALAKRVTPKYTARLLKIIETEAQHQLKAEHEDARTVSQANPLSVRESEVLRLIAKGLSNRQISDKLFVTTGTVKVHIHNIFEKLNAGSRTEAISKAKTLGLI